MLRSTVFALLLLFSLGSQAEELTDKKRAVIDQLVEVTGAANIAEMMGTATANQIITLLAQQGGELDPKLIAIVQDETAKIIYDEFIASGWLNRTSHRIYHKYLLESELRELLAFYQTPVGQKVISVLPQIAQESMLAGQQHGQSIGPVVEQRLQARFEAEGIQ